MFRETTVKSTSEVSDDGWLILKLESVWITVTSTWLFWYCVYPSSCGCLGWQSFSQYCWCSKYLSQCSTVSLFYPFLFPSSHSPDRASCQTWSGSLSNIACPFIQPMTLSRHWGRAEWEKGPPQTAGWDHTPYEDSVTTARDLRDKVRSAPCPSIIITTRDKGGGGWRLDTSAPELWTRE